jgi:hypothetical protein
MYYYSYNVAKKGKKHGRMSDFDCELLKVPTVRHTSDGTYVEVSVFGYGGPEPQGRKRHQIMMRIATSVALPTWHPHLYVINTPRYIHSAAYLQCRCAAKYNEVGEYLPDKV